ncbi:MAG: hypothetical protein E6J65_26185 [Deltaproteobacteria bacterium]|nr:MAG: hypothetical protein E6J65_26185 [Deltaproteobacteria bacterium]
MRSASRAVAESGKRKSSARSTPRVVLNDRDYLLGAFSATAVIFGATKPWVATEFVYIADYPPPRRASTFGRCSARCPTSE